ncbi:hypothetical protein ACWEJ6_47675 [Nonomuraea sp. NPDC004702]
MDRLATQDNDDGRETLEASELEQLAWWQHPLGRPRPKSRAAQAADLGIWPVIIVHTQLRPGRRRAEDPRRP